MEGRLGRILHKLKAQDTKTQKDQIVEQDQVPQGVDFQGLIWGKRLKTSEINDPEKVEDLFQNEPILGQTILPFDGNEDMEIYRTRTVKDILEDKFGKPSESAITKDLEKLKEFVGS